MPRFEERICYLLVMQDLFIKWVECCPLRKANGKKTREAIEDLIVRERRFINRDLKAFAEEYEIAHTTVLPYHPQANPVEQRERMERIQALRDWVVENLEAAHQRQSRYYNLRRRDVRFVVGDRVWKRQRLFHIIVVLSSAAHAISAKLATKYHGLFTNLEDLVASRLRAGGRRE
ncbi:hypothetical protein ACFW04_003701 [Cataglyphis niger]